jgi:hypothetical protein
VHHRWSANFNSPRYTYLLRRNVTAPARRWRPDSIPPALSPATAAARWADSTRPVEGAKAHLEATTSCSSRGQRRPCGDRRLGHQQLNLFPGAKYDGVFAMWYGKGPGRGPLRRRVPPRQRGRQLAQHGGVLVIAGDDHAAKSSTLPHQTEHFFKAMMMPVLAPANVQEYLDLRPARLGDEPLLGLLGGASRRWPTRSKPRPRSIDPLERAASCSPTISLPPTASTSAGPTRRWCRKRLLHHKLYAALAYCRANQLNRTSSIDRRPRPQPRLGIITSGKSLPRRAPGLDDLGIDDATGGARSASACTRSAWSGRSRPRACAASPRGWTKSWWSRKSANSSNTS